MDMRALVNGRVADLQKLDTTALCSLPAHSQEVVSLEGQRKGEVTISQYHETSDLGEHKVVVQAVRPRWLGLVTAIEVDGFVVTKEGTRRLLTEEEKWPYL